MEAELSNSPVQVGDVVAGKYRVQRTLGHGGIGVVVAAHHLALDEPVALKFIGLNLSADRDLAQRLLLEARATFRLRSKHTVRVFDADELASGDIYIVMELLDGRDLRAELAERGPMPEVEVLMHMLQACDALEEAHSLGIVHRDLKPHNLFLARQRHGPPIVKVLDFGMSKVDPGLFEAEAGPITLPEVALGTPRYMAPEQWRSAATVDHRADIWSMGVVLYELLTGKVPLQGMPLPERQARLLGGAIPSPKELRPDISESTARVIQRCLKADPMSRWRSIGHLAAALRDAAPASVDAERAEATQTAVTRVVATQDMQERATRAFAAQRSDEAAAVPALDTEMAVRAGRSDSDSSDVTVVRPPVFTPAELPADVGVRAVPRAAEAEPTSDRSELIVAMRGGSAQRAGPAPQLHVLMEATPPIDETLRLPWAPLRPQRRPAPPAETAGRATPGPSAAAASDRAASRGSTIAVLVALAIAAAVAGGVAAWLFGR